MKHLKYKILRWENTCRKKWIVLTARNCKLKCNCTEIYRFTVLEEKLKMIEDCDGWNFVECQNGWWKNRNELVMITNDRRMIFGWLEMNEMKSNVVNFDNLNLDQNTCCISIHYDAHQSNSFINFHQMIKQHSFPNWTTTQNSWYKIQTSRWQPDIRSMMYMLLQHSKMPP